MLALTASKVRDKRQAELDAGLKKMADGATATAHLPTETKRLRTRQRASPR